MRILLLASISLIAGLVAAYSRFVDHNLLQGLVPLMPGCDGRATVEHLLGGIAFGLGLTIFFVLGAAILCFAGKHGDPNPEPGESINLNDGWNLLRALIYTFGGSLFYLAATMLYEIDQAYLSVLSLKSPRGYMQWEQVTADVIGTMMAVMLAWLVLTRGIQSNMFFDQVDVQE